MTSEITRHELESWLDDTLQPGRFRDYCPNGLQVEGRTTIRHIVTGVTASQALIEAAVARGSDAILVHHGWFWKNENPCIRGPKHKRIAALIAADINLFAYHLPLDAHVEWGNNAQLARIMDWTPDIRPDGTPRRCGPDDLIWLGAPARDCTVAELAADIAHRLKRKPLVIGEPDRPVQRLAWCTGAAQSMMDAALAAGADCYVSGEISEPTVHLARETGSAYISAGHHATERYGVQALGAAIEAQFGVPCTFVDIDNPA
ncbi:MAG TPA: Nif3-like dinuclear metal center hexameric protein [Castellaniella sp.]|jgi:dinuclear metal center YbgI/SA1388 family protein|nr:Nif3-like dinuclear metal center hexameric protein [Castellaniella sp.]